MNFDYSYKAFFLTLLLVGGLLLIMILIKLPKVNMVLEEEYDLEYAMEDLFPEEELADNSAETKNIETHRAFNEAEEFISELEKERAKQSETTEDKLNEMNEAIEKSTNTIAVITSEEDENPEDNTEKSENTEAESNNQNSTNSYRLVDRTALYFPNPVYTCESHGRVVLNIEVNNKGKVVYTSINENSSTTTNQCLIDSAIKYAEKARFSSANNKPKQLGSITYVFPGQL